MTYLSKLQHISPQHHIIFVGIGVEITQCIEWMVNDLHISPSRLILVDQKKIHIHGILSQIPRDNIFENQTDFKCIHLIQNPLFLIKAPGIWSNNPEFEQFRAAHGKQSVISSLTFFLEYHAERCVGITGTKGKTTTSSLLYHLLNPITEVYYCGNSTGISPYKYWSHENAWFILELSSFQLQDLGNTHLSPALSIITNLYIDHQDVHHSVDEYWHAKTSIFTYATHPYITSEKTYQTLSELGYSHPALTVNEDNIPQFTKIFSSQLIGKHNTYNSIMAVCMYMIIIHNKKTYPTIADILAEISQHSDIHTRIQTLLLTFTPVPYRNELIHRCVRDTIEISFYNDAQGTTPESTICALQALTSHDNERCILLTGGKAKSPDYTELINTIQLLTAGNKILDIFLFDEIGTIIAQHISYDMNRPLHTPDFFNQGQLDFSPYISRCISEHIQRIHVLLSPAGSSFNEYNSYKDKGDAFTAWARLHR